MNLLDAMEHLASKIKRPILITLVAWIGISGFVFLYPSPYNSITISLFRIISSDLLPEGVEFIMPNPISALNTIMVLSFMIGAIFTLPIAIFCFTKMFPNPLYVNEKKLLRKINLSIFPLLGLGMAFAYFFFVPLCLKIFYYFVFALEGLPLVDIAFFTKFIFLTIVLMGFMFLTPVIMYVVSKIGVIKSSTWRKYLRIVIFISAFIGAIITPDGSVVTQLIFAGAFTGLYYIGYLITKKFV